MKRIAIILLILLAAAGAVYYYVHRRAQQSPLEVAYILPESVDVMNVPARVRIAVATVKRGEKVEVLERSRNWARVRLADGKVGWLEETNLLDALTHERGARLYLELQKEQVQAVGHTAFAATLRLEPSRDGPQIAQRRANQGVEVLGRRVVDRPAEPGKTGPQIPARDVWYLVRSENQAGWMLGTLVALDIPDAIAMYARAYNIVAWLVLNTVDDAGRQVPQYLAADRSGTQEFDFTRIRVFTWWVERQRYATSYAESRLKGFFPIRVEQRDGIPHFRLRLVDRAGRRMQKVYAMFHTIVRPLGIVEGWESQEIPSRQGTRGVRRR